MVCLCLNQTTVALKWKALGNMFSSFEDLDPVHFVENYRKKDVDALLYKITDSVTLSEWKGIRIENG